MENENLEQLEQELPQTEIPEEETPYVPRPVWQRIVAWICFVLFVAVIAMYYINMMRGGS